LEAQEVRFTLQVSAKRISMQDYLQVQYLVENHTKVSQFIPPRFRNFTVVEGPSQTTGFNIDNGNLEQYVSFSYLLKPEREGRMSIPSAVAKVDGRNYRSNEAEVMVTKAVQPGLPEGDAMMEEIILKKGETVEGKIRGNIFVRLEVDRKQVYVGEPVVAAYKLYTRLRSESRVTKRPSFSGFSVYDMANPENGESTRETLNGREYNVYLLRKVQLYPLQEGSLELEPAEVENDISFVEAEKLGQAYGSAEVLRDLSNGGNLSGAVTRRNVTLRSEPVQVVVKALPGDSGSIQTGAVGQFSVRTFLQEVEVHKGDLVDLHIQVAGKGNFPMIIAPTVEWPSGVDVFESSMAENYNRFVSPLSGSKLFSIPFTAKAKGRLNIPPVSFRYFDPVKGKYMTARSEPLLIDVLPARPRPAGLPGQREEKPAQAWKYILSALGVILFFGGLYVLLKRVAAPAVKAVSKADEPQPFIVPEKKDPLEQIRQAFDRGDARDFYRQLSVVINECMMNKYQVDGNGNWEQGLAQKGVDGSLIREIGALKADAELAMYTPFVVEGKMVEDLARIERIVC
jgi:hypothetical protein